MSGKTQVSSSRRFPGRSLSGLPKSAAKLSTPHNIRSSHLVFNCIFPLAIPVSLAEKPHGRSIVCGKAPYLYCLNRDTRDERRFAWFLRTSPFDSLSLKGKGRVPVWVLSLARVAAGEGVRRVRAMISSASPVLTSFQSCCIESVGMLVAYPQFF